MNAIRREKPTDSLQIRNTLIARKGCPRRWHLWGGGGGGRRPYLLPVVGRMWKHGAHMEHKLVVFVRRVQGMRSCRIS